MSLQNETVSILSNLISALSIEIATIKGKNNQQTINAKNGHLLENIGSTFIYKFTLEDSFDVPDDTDVLIKINSNSYNAIIINCKGLELILSCESDLGDNASITIFISTTNLLESLKKLLGEIKLENIHIREDLLLKLFGVIEPAEDKFPEFFFPPIPDFELDEFQKDVISKSLNSEVSFIWGPPGTGKTAVIAALTKILIDSGLSVLITSNTNIAVDNAFEKFIQFFKETSADLSNGKIIRYGNIQVEGIKDLVQESNIVLRLGAPLFKELNKLNKELASQRKQKNNLEESIKEYSKYESFKKKLNESQKYLSNTFKQLKQAEQNFKTTEISIKQSNAKILELQYLLKVSISTNAVIRLFKGIKSPKTINSEISSTKNSLSQLSLDKNRFLNTITSQKNQYAQLKSKIEKTTSEITVLENKYPVFKNFSAKSIKSQLKLLDEQINSLLAEISDIEKKIEDLEKNLINDAKVLGTTLSMFHSQSKLYSRNFDIVIIDEVTMAILPQIFFASSFAKSKIIIVGDFYQLQSIVKTKNNNTVTEWLKNDIFRKNNITDGTSPKLNKLCIQRRMNPAIAEISNKCLYNSILQHSPVDSFLENEIPVSFYNTSGFSPYSTIPPSGFGRTNIYNAVLSVKIAQEYFSNNLIKNIGIITPYRKQANIISKLLRETKLNNKVSADTVHKFQGLEKDLIIFDITDGINTKNYPIGAHLRDNNEGPYLFNVSFTRAKKKLIIIGDLNYLRDNMNRFPQKVRSMFDIFLTTNNNYEIIDSTTVLDTITIQNDPSLQLIITQSNNIIQFSEQTFYQDFQNEISKCTGTLKIYSPFIASNRIRNNFTDHFFKSLLDKRVKIKIVTKPSREHPQTNRNFATECINKWRQSGIHVFEQNNMHEKVAIIDNKIIYVGSLNILSQWRSGETMLKIFGSDSIKELLKIYNNLY